MSQSEAETLPVKDFEGLLKRCFGDTYKLNRVTWKHLTNPGENFGSLILAVTVDIVRNSLSNDATERIDMVVKLPPNSAYLITLFNSPVTFKKELTFYENIVPALIELQNKYGLYNDQQCHFVPRFFGGRLGFKDPKQFDEQGAIILENLRPRNYVVQDRIVGLDLQHIKFAASELAKFHATVICMKETRPDFFKTIVLPSLQPPANDITKQSICDMIRKAYDDLKDMPDMKQYLKNIQNTLEVADVTREVLQVHDDAWNTLLHNDFWVNNMMFCYDNAGQIKDMKMVDFQLCVYDCGIKDLIFFLISSSKKEVLDNNIDEALDAYYNSFIESLKLLKIDTQKNYSKEKFLKLINECAPGRFAQCIMMVHVIQAARGKTPKMEKISSAQDMLGKGNDEVCKEKLRHIAQIYDKLNWWQK